jgi:ATP synthase protein I
MTEGQPKKASKGTSFADQVGKKAARMLKARTNPKEVTWFGLGMMGVIGWSVALPTLLGIGVGAWLDNRFAGTHSWTLALLVAGLTIGCFNAWLWVAKQNTEMHREDESHGD